ncbi:hypothetical protein Esti_005836 [Eimeria stiedai]
MASRPEWEPIGKASDGLPIYEVESILDQQGEGDAAIECTFGRATKGNSFGATVAYARTGGNWTEPDHDSSLAIWHDVDVLNCPDGN